MPGKHAVILCRLRDFYQQRQCRSITSQLIEDCFGVIKRKSDCKSNTTCTSSFAHAVLIDENVVGSKHAYMDLDRSSEVVERGAQPLTNANVLTRPSSVQM